MLPADSVCGQSTTCSVEPGGRSFGPSKNPSWQGYRRSEMAAEKIRLTKMTKASG